MRKKIFVFIILVLFIGASIVPIISSINLQLDNVLTNSKSLSFNPFKEGWKYRKKITIDHTQIAGNLANFPVLVSTIDSDLRDKAQIDGDDILFMDDKGEAEPLYHEIEYFDDSTGELVAWVNIPILSTAVDIDFFMYYGNLNCASQEYPEMVWDSDYIHVWHMGDNLMDSAGSDDGNDHGTSIITGKIGKSRDFEKIEQDFIDFGDMSQPADGVLDVGTWEVWINIDNVNDPGNPLMIKHSTGTNGDSYYSSISPGGKPRYILFAKDGSNRFEFKVDNQEIYSSNWHYLAFGITIGSVRNIDIYVDGLEVPSTKTSVGTQPTVFRNINVVDEIGRFRPEAGPSFFDYKIDEMVKNCKK